MSWSSSRHVAQLFKHIDMYASKNIRRFNLSTMQPAEFYKVIFENFHFNI
jgi:hypothetical protein